LGGSFGGGATSAVWTDGGAGGSFTNNGGATSNTATYTAGAASGTPVTLTLTTVGGSCGTTNVNKSITINPKPTITPAATAVSKCFNAGAQNTTLTYSVVTNAPTNYTIIWNAAAIAAGLVNVVSTALPASPIIVPIAAGVVAGIYTGTLAVTNGNGCVSTGVTFTVTINPFPGAAGIITGTSTISSIQSGVSYSIAAVPNATSYFWNYTGNNVTINNNTSNNVNLDFPFNATSGILTTKGSNACGTGTVSPDYAITVSILPGTPGVISGTAIVCQGFVGATYSVAAISNATGYVWALPIGGNITTGTNTNNITVTYSSSATSGNVTVYGTNASGNGPTSAGYAVTVDPTPVSGPTYRLPNQ
jgi:hypothetical protein